LVFYFPHIKYGKYCFHLQLFFIANFHVLEPFKPKKRYKSEIFFPSVTRRCRRFWTNFEAVSSAVLGSRKLGASVAQWLACWYCTTEGLGSNLGTGSIFSERPLERFSNRILSCTKSTPPSYGDLSSKNLRNRTMPVNGNKQ
jgi:hypothetical protein